jgi:uncharacterized circularly permuted ATP-grasp superfamily protein
MGVPWRPPSAACQAVELRFWRIFTDPRSCCGQGLPPELVFPNPAFLRPCCHVPVPGDVYLHIYAADLARSPDGQWWVIADRTQAPSGAGYALENRLVSTRVLPDVFRTAHVRRLAGFFQTYRKTLRSLAPGSAKIRALWCSRRGRITKPISSTPFWPGIWATRWWKAAT